MLVKKGFKLFEMDSNGKLFPLFIGKTKETPIDEWIDGEIIPTKSFKTRPGWHLNCELPSAVHLMSADGTYKSQRGKNFKRVWCEIEYIADIDYTSCVQMLPDKCFTDRLPNNGFYKFKESGNRLWIIADKIKVTRILSENERQNILKEMNYNEVEAFAPYKASFEKRMKKAV